MNRRVFLSSTSALACLVPSVLGGTSVKFRDIERLENGKWERADFANLHTGDVFRFMDKITEEMRCCGHAYPLNGIDGNYGVECDTITMHFSNKGEKPIG